MDDLPSGDAAPVPSSRTWAALVGIVALLLVVNVVRSTVVPGRFHLAFNLANGVAVAAVAALGAMTAPELGLDRASVRSGLRWGAIAFGAITAVVVVAAIVPAGRSALGDGRTDVSAAGMLLRVLVVIPLGTVLVEELAFRGVLLGLLGRVASAGRALVASAVVFGLWHLLPVWRGGGAGELGAGGSIGAVAGTFVATFVAGIGFGWLRQRSGSLVAPICAHIGTNSATFAAAWLVAR